MNQEKSPVSQLGSETLLRNFDQPYRASRQPTDDPAQIITRQGKNCISFWKDATTAQNSMEHYMALNCQYTMAEYLTTMTDQTLRH